MNTIKSMIFGPTPEEQKRKCNTLIRANTRKLDRDIQNLKMLETKTKNFIVAANKRRQRNASHATQAAQETRIFAKELIRVRKQSSRLQTSRAQLQSVQMQVNEAFSVRKIEGSIKASTGIMRDVNSLVRLPELSGTMRELSQELMKAGIIEEMVDDTLTTNDLEDEEEVETEVDKVLGEVLRDRSESVPHNRLTDLAEPSQEDADAEQEDMLQQMRGRLEGLRS